MENVKATIRKPLPLAQMIEASNSSIDFQLPAVLCYCTLNVAPILAEKDLIEEINRILRSQSFLVKPDNIDLQNWKLADRSGKVIDIKSWNAMEHVGTIIMVTFDREYVNGEHHGISWEMCGPGYVLDLQNRGMQLAEKNFPKLHDGHHIVQVDFRYRSKLEKLWISKKKEAYLVPADLKLSALANALVGTSAVQIRSSTTKSTPDGSETSRFEAYHRNSQTVGEVGDGIAVKLDFFIN